ncbi:TOBE domain-containing protein [Mucilaginibacter sp.]
MDINKVNTIQGTIHQVETDGHVSLVTVNTGGETFTALSNATPENASWLKKDEAVSLEFKASDMAIAKLFSGAISIRNFFKATVTAIEAGNVLTEVVLNYNGQTLYSVITNNAANALNLNEGDEVTGMVKSTEMTVTYV